jgi:hypothetical protein
LDERGWRLPEHFSNRIEIKIAFAFAIKPSKLFFVEIIQDNQSTSPTLYHQSPTNMSTSKPNKKAPSTLAFSEWEAGGREDQLRRDKKEEERLVKEGKKVPSELRKRIVEAEKAKEGRGRQFRRVPKKQHSSLGSPAPPQSRSGAEEEENEKVVVTRAESVDARSKSRKREKDRTHSRTRGTDTH